MSRTIKALLLSLSVALVLFTVAGGLRVRAAEDDGAYRQLGVYSEVLSRIRTEYVEEPNIPQVTNGALHGLLESLDADSSYLTAAEYKDYEKHQSEAKGQFGATVSKRFGYAAVVSIIPGGAADKGGVQNGDIFEAIEGKSTREMSLAEVHQALDGPVGSKVNVSVVRAGKAEPVKLTITRDVEKIPPASEKILQSNIGYIKVDALPKGKAQEIAAKIKAAQEQGAKKLILDLRDTSDGDEDEGVAVANLFLDHGTITYLQGQKYPRETFTADAKKAVTNLPLVVLVNRGTGGPAEIVASAILENARGDVVGDKTFGMGSIQKVIPMQDGSALILSIAKYYTPNGKAIQDDAVTPNITVADNNDDFVLPDDDDNNDAATQPEKKPKTVENDQQLQRAIQVLENKDKKAA
ncbi:MAG TPA: S41 family peptidase [Terriglobales bacterium]|nr:S41 family peptidase [Terriglobales bacterium]